MKKPLIIKMKGIKLISGFRNTQSILLVFVILASIRGNSQDFSCYWNHLTMDQEICEPELWMACDYGLEESPDSLLYDSMQFDNYFYNITSPIKGDSGWKLYLSENKNQDYCLYSQLAYEPPKKILHHKFNIPWKHQFVDPVWEVGK